MWETIHQRWRARSSDIVQTDCQEEAFLLLSHPIWLSCSCWIGNLINTHFSCCTDNGNILNSFVTLFLIIFLLLFLWQPVSDFSSARAWHSLLSPAFPPGNQREKGIPDNGWLIWKPRFFSFLLNESYDLALIMSQIHQIFIETIYLCLASLARLPLDIDCERKSIAIWSSPSMRSMHITRCQLVSSTACPARSDCQTSCNDKNKICQSLDNEQNTARSVIVVLHRFRRAIKKANHDRYVLLRICIALYWWFSLYRWCLD